MNEDKAILAGGCFWGMQDLIRKRPGVIGTRVGYTGGNKPFASYADVKTGETGHAEAIEITFDSTKTSYRDLLEFFFQMHDPTTENRQGNDVGTQYRSAIFYTSEHQKRVAEEIIKDIEDAKIFHFPVVTEIVEASDFYEAEDFHQDYLKKNPSGYTCHFVRPNWKLPKK